MKQTADTLCMNDVNLTYKEDENPLLCQAERWYEGRTFCLIPIRMKSPEAFRVLVMVGGWHVD